MDGLTKVIEQAFKNYPGDARLHYYVIRTISECIKGQATPGLIKQLILRLFCSIFIFQNWCIKTFPTNMNFFVSITTNGNVIILAC